MSNAKNYIAIDLGASSGRVILGAVADGKINLEELHRFENGPIENAGCLQWDFARLTDEIEAGLAKAVKHTKGKIESIGVDSWGVDFGLIDSSGRLLENPYHYRDKRTDNMMEKVFEVVPRKTVYDITGIQFMQINSLYQLVSQKYQRPDFLKKADKLLFMADLVSYHLSGAVFSEYTLASTSQLMDMNKGKWAEELFEKLSLPLNIMSPIVQAGTAVGRLKKQIADKLGCSQIPVIAVGSHDTACAVAAVPANFQSQISNIKSQVSDVKSDWAYLSSGTWSLMGLELPGTLINEDSYKYQFTNEGGINNTIRLLKNIMGLWLVQECRRVWNQQGDKLSFADLSAMAKNAKPFAAFINPNDNRFLSQCDMPAVINQYLVEHGNAKIDDKGQLIRIILESLSLYYRRVFDLLESMTGKKIEVLHIVGGGIKDKLLCQFTSDSIGKKVIAGPVEATAMGNIMIQAISAKQIANVAEGRKIIGNSVELAIYRPQQHEVWNEKYQQNKHIFES